MYQRWHELNLKAGVESPLVDEVFGEIRNAYTEPGRAYHNLHHIADCLHVLDQFAEFEAVDHLFAVEMVIWFHDVIYDVLRKDNEEESARFAEERLMQLGYAAATIDSSVALILNTKHDEEPKLYPGRVIADIDLSILGSDGSVYTEYCRNIRREYACYSDQDYRKGRTVVLELFLNREQIYLTKFGKDKFEEAARRNLLHELNSI